MIFMAKHRHKLGSIEMSGPMKGILSMNKESKHPCFFIVLFTIKGSVAAIYHKSW